MSVVARSSLRLEAHALAMRQIGGWLTDATDLLATGTAPGLTARAELAVHEACMNVVDHARLPEGSLIELTLVLTTDRLTVTVADDGDEFLLSAVPSPAPGNLQERGFGVKIIRTLVSELSYRRIGSRNELELRIDIEEQQ